MQISGKSKQSNSGDTHVKEDKKQKIHYEMVAAVTVDNKSKGKQK